MRRFDYKKLAPLIAEFARANDLVYVGFFGSEARGVARDDSDVDVMIQLRNPVGFMKFVDMQEKLSELLQKKVDLQTKKSIDPKIKPFIEKDLITLYEE